MPNNTHSLQGRLEINGLPCMYMHSLGSPRTHAYVQLLQRPRPGCLPPCLPEGASFLEACALNIAEFLKAKPWCIPSPSALTLVHS